MSFCVTGVNVRDAADFMMPFYRYFFISIFLFLSLPLRCEGGMVKLLLPQQLHQLSADSVKIIDARPLEQWQKGHIPGALSFDWQSNTETDQQGVAYRKLPSVVLAKRLGLMGIDEHSRLVVYGDADSSWGGEGWVCWLLRELGHIGEIDLLDGGVQAWRKLYGELSVAAPIIVTPTSYRVAERRELNITTEELKRADLQLVDTRSFFEWLSGSLPGAVRISWTEFYRGEERRPLGRRALIALLQEKGVDPEKPVVYYCSGGIRSAYAWTVHELAGLRSAINYEGGMEAWRKLR